MKFRNYIIIFFAYYFSLGIFSSILSIYLTGIGKTATEMSLIMSAANIFSFIMLPVAGYLNDRTYNSKGISRVLLLAAALLGLIFGYSRQTWVLFILNGLILACINSVMPICEKIAAASPYGYGKIRVWGAVGFACAAQLSGFTYEYLGPQYIYIFFAISLTVTIFGFSDFYDVNQDDVMQEKEKGKCFWGIFKKDFILFLAVCFIFAGATGVSNTYLPILINQSVSTITGTGTVLFLATLMEIPVILFSGRFMDRLSGKYLLMLNFAAIFIQFLCYGIIRQPLAVITACVLLKSFSTMAFIMITLKIVVNVVDCGFTTTALSIVAMAKTFGAIFFQNSGGRFVDYAGITALYGILTGLSLLGLFLSALLNIKSRVRIFGSAVTDK